MFHGVSLQIQGGAAMNNVLARQIASGLQEDENRIATVISERTHLTDEQIREFFDAGDTKDALYAQKVGLISEVVLPRIAAGVPRRAADGGVGGALATAALGELVWGTVLARSPGARPRVGCSERARACTEKESILTEGIPCKSSQYGFTQYFQSAPRPTGVAVVQFWRE